MNLDVWVVEAGSRAGVQQVLGLLPRQRVSVVSLTDLKSMDGEATRPAALIGVANSWCRDNKRKLKFVIKYASKLPVIVIDDAFDAQAARWLAAGGVQDYLSSDGLTADRLVASLEFAVIRDGHLRVRNLRPLMEVRPDLDLDALRATVRRLPQREREVFNLLVTCLPTDALADRLGKKRQTILNQIASLKQRFEVDSREDLIVISILCLPETK